jgi:hypothetical protein
VACKQKCRRNEDESHVSIVPVIFSVQNVAPSGNCEIRPNCNAFATSVICPPIS